MTVSTGMKGTNGAMLTTSVLEEPPLDEGGYDQIRHGIELIDVDEEDDEDGGR